MNQYIDTLQPLFGNTLWVYFLEAPSKGNMDGAAVMERFQEDVDKFMKEKGGGRLELAIACKGDWRLLPVLFADILMRNKETVMKKKEKSIYPLYALIPALP